VTIKLDALIHRADQADGESADRLFALLYAELHRLAEHALRHAAPVTLGATTLVHEAYLDMTGRDGLSFADRSRFFASAARAMRGLIVDYARQRRALKRGHQFEITVADEEMPSTAVLQKAADLATLADALDALTTLAPALAELVDQHFFCGFSFAEIAAFRGVSERTVQRDWRKARILLRHALLDDDSGDAYGGAAG
jgi:RNA polymerase sigma factor (TIGR02999 family)